MLRKAKDIAIALLLGFVCPAMIFSLEYKKTGDNSLIPTTTNLSVSITEEESTLVSVLQEDGNVKKMDIDTYLTAVVLREMPADFEIEALKAQAVVARTYTLRRIEKGGKHEYADVCTDTSCCQGYCTPEEYLDEGGEQALIDRVSEAVLSTQNQVLIFDGEMIDATYFSCSGGKTEDALAVWGANIPYLQSVESPGEEGSSGFINTVTFQTSEISTILGVKLEGNPTAWVEKISYTKGGGVSQMQICGKTFSGTQLRSLLGLRSTAFAMTIVGDTVTITTKGFGHRVGMSQYGADAMAVQGKSYEQILLHYYQGAVLSTYSN